MPSITPTKAIAEPIEEVVEVVEAPPIAVVENVPERPNKRELRTKVIEPPELIVVEMTEEEQDVYSLIGVSPLVLVDREVKDPRNVIVTVALPGQAPKAANSIPPSRGSDEVNFQEDIAPSEITETGSEIAESELLSEPLSESLSEPLSESLSEPSEEITAAVTVSNNVANNNNGVVNPNGVILKVNRAQPFDSFEAGLGRDPQVDSLDTSKEFVPIQSPEASRRKRSSAL